MGIDEIDYFALGVADAYDDVLGRWVELDWSVQDITTIANAGCNGSAVEKATYRAGYMAQVEAMRSIDNPPRFSTDEPVIRYHHEKEETESVLHRNRSD